MYGLGLGSGTGTYRNLGWPVQNTHQSDEVGPSTLARKVAPISHMGGEHTTRIDTELAADRTLYRVSYPTVGLIYPVVQCYLAVGVPMWPGPIIKRGIRHRNQPARELCRGLFAVNPVD